MLTYTQAAAKFARAKDKSQGYRLSKCTRLLGEPDLFRVRLYSTDVVTIHADGRYTLTSGGWLTPTTRSYIEQVAPVRIWASGSCFWMFKSRGGTGPYVFRDGVVVDSTGRPLGKTLNPESVLDKKKKLDQQIRRYIAGFCRHLSCLNEFPDMGSDCLACRYKADPRDTEGVMGKSGHGHLLDHLRESYYVPTLAFNAVQEQGWKVGYVGGLLRAGIEQDKPLLIDQAVDIIRRALTGYFRRRKMALMGLTDHYAGAWEHTTSWRKKPAQAW